MNINKELTKKVDRLIEITKHLDTREVIGMINVEFQVHFMQRNVFEATNLISPFKQYIYLLNLLLSNPKVECEDQVAFEDSYEEIKKLLNEISQLYAFIFFPENTEEISDTWRRHRELAMPVFMNYFNMHSLPYEEQIIERLIDWASPFNSTLQETIGISVNESIEMYRYIQKMLQEQLTSTRNDTLQLLKAHEFFVALMEREKIDFDIAMEKTREAFPSNSNPFEQDFFKINLSKFEDKFSVEKTECFFNVFSCEREESEFYYYTEKGNFDTRPIIKINGQYYVPIYKQILHAFEYKFFEILENSDKRSSFLKNRDNKSEEKTKSIFEKLFGTNAEYFTSAFESPDSQNEHDLLIKTKNNTIYIVEVKASKFKEPFRDPDKAYQRIKRDFKSDGGIQKAYNQAKSLHDLIMKQERTHLYNQSGEVITSIERSKIKAIYTICVTAENFGIVASNLSYLLEKGLEDKYPYAVNIFDLESIVEYIEYKKIPVIKFNEYLDFRSKYHDKLIAGDELDIFGLFQNRIDIKKLNSVDKYFVSHEYSDIFDEMYFTKLGIIEKIRKPRAKHKNNHKTKNRKRMAKASKRRNRK